MGNAPGKPHPRPRNKRSVSSKATDRAAPPGKPYLSTELEATPDILTICWDPPMHVGGPPVTGYLVEHRRTGSPHWVKATPLMVRVPELTLSGLEPGWRYQFRVFAENVVGLSEPSELSELLTVTLQRSAIVAPRFTQELKDTTALENNKVEFVAHFIGQPFPKLAWFKDEFEIFSSRRTRILTEQDRSTLTIHQSAISDEGEIKCSATNKAGHVSTKAKLTLEAPPHIRLPRNYEDGLLFEIGEVIRLKVSVAGLPSPLVFWTHNGESIQENERYDIETTDRSSTLRISEAIRNDRGEYHIKAVNKIGSDISSFLVTVTDKPSPPGKAKVLMTLGRSVTLSWNTPSDDGGCKIGNYIVEYYRLGWNVWLKAATSRQLSAMLGDLIEGSEYKFRVKAESPFGVSEPSEESDLVFIPDPKRGILVPTPRSKSQPRELVDEDIPIAARRKNKPRSHSSSRGEPYPDDDVEVNAPPLKPKHIQIKTPPKSPDLSPRHIRKENLNQSFFDRASMARDLAYGSPEIKLKKPEFNMNKIPPVEIPKTLPVREIAAKNTIHVISNQKQRSPSPRALSPHKSRSPSPNRNLTFSKDNSPQPANVSVTSKLSRDNSENLGGSSEFMMVLYPSENHKDMGSTSDFGFELENGLSIAPPLSLSAPELGAEPPVFETLRLSASSTELLHERAMVRFYEEALAEEEDMKRRQQKLEGENKSDYIPKIQINSQDNQHIVGLEKKHSLRRRLSAGGSVPQQVIMAQRRQSLRNSNDFTDIFDLKLHKFPLTVDEKRDIMKNRQRSESEEKEEMIFENVRSRMAETNAMPRKKKISIVKEEIWDPVEGEDYEESVTEEESESEDERHKEIVKIKEIKLDDEDEEIYHPRMMIAQPQSIKSKYEEPFEILTKPAKLPDANFVPKPILKKTETNGDNVMQPTQHSMEQNMQQRDALLDRLYQQKANRTPSQTFTKRGSLPDVAVVLPDANTQRDTSAVARISSIAATGFILSQPLLRKKEDEDSKVVIDHYGDIVRNYGRKLSQPEINPVREALKKAASIQAQKYSDTEENDLTPISNNEKINVFGKRFDENEKKFNQSVSQEPTRISVLKQSKMETVPSIQEQQIRIPFLKQNPIETVPIIQEQPRSATPIFKQNIRHEEKLITNAKIDKHMGDNNVQSAPNHRKSISDERQEARGRHQTRRIVSKSPHPNKTTDSSASDTSSRSSSALRQTNKQQVRSDTPARGQTARSDSELRGRTRSDSATRKQVRSDSATRKQVRSDSATRGQARPDSEVRGRTRSDSATRVQSRSNSLIKAQSRSNSKTALRKSKSPSPVPFLLRKPKMCEIMTQTSTSIDPYQTKGTQISVPIPANINKMAQIKVRSTVDYVTDLAMFAVACYIFLFSNELYAIPVLLVAVYRQLKEYIKSRIPNWIKKRWGAKM